MNVKTVPSQSEEQRAERIVDIELLALDLDTCTRCTGTLENIRTALDVVEPMLAATDTDVHVREVLIETEEQAAAHHFVTSPTVRIGGRDIAFDTVERPCDSCTELCGCEGSVNCRVWPYRGEEYTEAPVGLVVEAVLHEIYGGAASSSGPDAYEGVPENLQRFFASKAASRSPEASSCCSAAEQAVCCESEEKASCCEASVPATCGC